MSLLFIGKLDCIVSVDYSTIIDVVSANRKTKVKRRKDVLMQIQIAPNLRNHLHWLDINLRLTCSLNYNLL